MDRVLFIYKLNSPSLLSVLPNLTGLALFLCPLFCQCQPPQLFFNHLNQKDGLSQTTNNVVFKDSKGFVWISSLNGLNRYDGQRIKSYKNKQGDPNSLPDNYIQSRIIEDSSANLWFTTNEALVCYVRKHDHFLAFQDTAADGTARKGYQSAFQVDKDILGIIVGGTDLKTFSLASKRWSLWLEFPSLMYRAIPLRDGKGAVNTVMAFNYDKPGIFFMNAQPGKTEKYSARFNGNNEKPEIHASDAVQYGDTVVVAAREGYLRFYLTDKQWELYPTHGWYPNKLAMYGRDKIMASLKGGGWQFIDKKELSEVRQFLHDPANPWSIASNTVYGVWEDYDGVIWTGVWGIGVDFTQPRKVKFSTLDLAGLWGVEGQPVGIYSIAEDKEGNVWCSTRSSGIFVVTADKKPIAHFINKNKTDQVLPGNDVPYFFIDSKSRCWAVSWSGLGWLSPGNVKFSPIAPNETYLHGIELNGQRLIFSNAAGGIDILNESGGAMKMEKLAPVKTSAFYTYLFQNRNGLLFACRDLSNIEIRDPSDNFSLLKDLPIKGDIQYFYEDVEVNALWIATSNGLVCLDQDNWQWGGLTEEDGLPDNQIYAVTADRNGSLWLSTNRGLARFFLNENRFHAFDMPDGLQGLEYNPHSFLQHSNGTFWFGGINGANFFQPDKINLISSHPKVQFTRLWANEKEIPHPECALTKATNISEAKKLEFSYEENTLGFEFAALEFSNPSKNAFQYRMEGYEEGWVNAGTRGFARYPNLPPGEYSFQVKAANSDGIWSKPESIQIVIIPPVWQRWWFITLAVMAFLSAIYGVYKYRLNQLLKVERLRNQISSDLHDDIGSTLSNVGILSALIKQKFSANKEALPLLERIDEEVQSSSESLDDIIWSINPKNDPVDRILARMRRFASEVFEAKEINGKIDFSVEAKKLKLNMEKRRHFYLLFKEAVNNLAKYSNCKNATVRVNYLNGNLSLVVSDDGVGFNPNTAGETGNGLMTMQRRAKKLRAKLDIQSAVGKGTTISVLFPITEIRDSKTE